MREEEKTTSLGSKWKRILRKKWVLPSIYIASAAVILTGALWFQSNIDFFGSNEPEEKEEVADNSNAYTDPFATQEAVPVNVTEEVFKMPVVDEQSVVIKKQFYEYEASSEEQEAALVFYNNKYYPSTGIDIAQENGESFDVVASLSGTVVRAENDPILGNVVEIQHENDVSTYYQSLDEIHVETGSKVEQGEVIGTAGTSVFNQEVGVHVHFEIRQNDEPMNPLDFFNKSLSSLENEEQNNATEDITDPNEESESTSDSDNQETDTELEENHEQEETEEDQQNINDENVSISMTRA